MEGVEPSVSVGMPVYNGERYIRQALDSIRAQTFGDFELVICDNASTDKTEEICRQYAGLDSRIHYHRNEDNIGASRNFNLVCAHSSGEFFKWAAHDDVLDPRYLKCCVQALRDQPTAVLSFPRISYIDENGDAISNEDGNLTIDDENPANRLRRLIDFKLKNDDIFWSVFGLYRTEALRKTKLMASFIAADQALLVNLILLGSFVQVPEHLFYRRAHPDESMTKHGTPEARARWFDPQITSGVIAPNWRLFREELRSIRGQDIPFATKTRCYSQVVRLFAHRWRTLGSEIRRAVLRLVRPGKAAS